MPVWGMWYINGYIFKKGVYTVYTRPLGMPFQGYMDSGTYRCMPCRTEDAARYTVGFERLCAALRPRKFNDTELTFRNALYPNLANVDDIVNMCDTEGSMGPAQTAPASVSTEQAAIKFDWKKFFSWRDARDEYTRVSNRETS
jgi:hypothetical protein